MKYILAKKDDKRALISEGYNYIFNAKSGYFARWGKNENVDPMFCPFGCEIADIEITTSCCGIPDKNGKRSPCSFCYKSNTPNGTYMPFETFKKVFDSLPKMLTQIAFGVDAQCKTNPDVFKIFEYCRENGVVPNVTVADIDEDTAKKLAYYCGSVAVSRYPNKDICYNTIQRLANEGLKQINIHVMLSEETKDMVLETMRDYKSDKRLEKLNAIVMLSLKQKGRGEKYTPVSQETFKEIVDFAISNKIPIGFDSCSYHKFINSVPSDKKEKYDVYSEPCESGLFSMYCNVEGKFFPCSFCEGQDEWADGIDMTNIKDFVKDIWYNPRVLEWRKTLLCNNRSCPKFRI